jgi:2-polyprenyl-3-methyl-5-hydroxy-6-metoxy-1,4-benzoquinol methylase
MICRYCQIIHSFNNSYPLREATRNTKSRYPRCDWHWRFVCSVCGRTKHFNGITWCDEGKKFICLSCAKSHRVVRRKFWNWKYYYALECDTCGEHHSALDYLEFSGKHPWQLHPNMEKKRTDLDKEIEFQPDMPIYFPLNKVVITDEEIAKAWDSLADDWTRGGTEHGDLNREHVIDPAIFRGLGDVRDSSILDAGCGNGYFSRLLARKGAKVVGIDLSRRFIEIAKEAEKKTPLGITYHVGTMADLLKFQDETFDTVVSNMALMDVYGLNEAMLEVRRVLKENGKLVFSIMHPCFSSSPVHGWVRNPADSQRKEDWVYWKVDRYFDESVQVWQYLDWPHTYSFHRPLSHYVNVLLETGFTITDFEEPIPTKKAMQEHYREFGDEYNRIPWFLVIGAKKT